jgi:hypothetical protein
LKQYRDGGAPAIADRRRGRPSNNRLSDAVRDYAIALVRQYYTDFGEARQKRQKLAATAETGN